MTAGTFLIVGRAAATLYDREAIALSLNGYAYEYWSKNLTGVRVETRSAIATFRPASLVKGAITFTVAGGTRTANEPARKAA